MRVAAELGVHSVTNFYKGLSSNDIIESGGIFVATYQIPTIGRELLIHVTMPGGYEFEAKGIVRWTREAPLSAAGGAGEAPPGFGAQFTEITAEAKQLVYRYVRNREPLFHDDL
jgi:Tfp pilus assembly protein PilZ